MALDVGAVEGPVGVTAVAVQGDYQWLGHGDGALVGGPGHPPSHLVVGPEP